MRDGYIARWSGEEYEASPDGDFVRLYRPDPADGFDEVGPGRYRKVVSADEAKLDYVRTICKWREQEFIVLAEHEGWLRVEYVGGLGPVARELGLEEFEYGVYQGWAPASEVSEVHEGRI